MRERDQPQESANDQGEDTVNLAEFRGVVLADVISVETVLEPPLAPAQPPAVDPDPADEAQ